MATLRLDEENVEGKVANVKYDEDGLPIAKNHAGWIVQEYTDDGWKRITSPLVRKQDARTIRDGCIARRPNNEYRVYEALQV